MDVLADVSEPPPLPLQNVPAATCTVVVSMFVIMASGKTTAYFITVCTN